MSFGKELMHPYCASYKQVITKWWTHKIHYVEQPTESFGGTILEQTENGMIAKKSFDLFHPAQTAQADTSEYVLH